MPMKEGEKIDLWWLEGGWRVDKQREGDAELRPSLRCVFLVGGCVPGDGIVLVDDGTAAACALREILAAGASVGFHADCGLLGHATGSATSRGLSLECRGRRRPVIERRYGR